MIYSSTYKSKCLGFKTKRLKGPEPTQEPDEIKSKRIIQQNGKAKKEMLARNRTWKPRRNHSVIFNWHSLFSAGWKIGNMNHIFAPMGTVRAKVKGKDERRRGGSGGGWGGSAKSIFNHYHQQSATTERGGGKKVKIEQSSCHHAWGFSLRPDILSVEREGNVTSPASLLQPWLRCVGGSAHAIPYIKDGLTLVRIISSLAEVLQSNSIQSKMNKVYLLISNSKYLL